MEYRYFISSLKEDIELASRAVRGHWCIESMHWHLDVTFREDANATIDKTAAQNQNIIRKWCLSILKVTELSKRKLSMKKKRFAIENQLHWCLDVLFREDKARARKDLSPLNLNIMRKIALALCKNADFGKRVSLQKRRYWACLDPDTFLRILFQ